ncbi:MAG: alanyl-tRNA editing protein [Tuberibacillus sp.]
MTEKLFYQDPYMTSFEAAVIENGKDKEGHAYVVLDKTAFYPTGGGQPFDKGTLNGVQVVNVEMIDGKVVHFLETPIEESQVKGEIDWNRRFDHMQQHAGQHILSAAFADRFGLKTLSFHLGSEDVTIDLSTFSLTEDQVREAERIANSVIYQNKPIKTIWVEEKDLESYPLRKPPKVTENIRLVIIDDYDYNACGGTHPATTGEVGPIHILSWEKNPKGTRIHFLCGWRAIAAFTEKQNVLQILNKKLSSSENDLPEKVDQLLAKHHELEKSLKEAEEQLLKHEADELIKKARSLGGFDLVARAFLNRDVSECQLLARFITEQGDNMAVLFTTKDGSRLHILGHRGKNVDGIDMRELIQSGLELINGRGGGKPERAQGGGETDLTAEGMLSYLIHQLEKEKVAG